MVIRIQFHVTNNMKKEELIEVKGGVGLSAALINAISRGVNTLYNLGVAVGSAIRRAFKKKICY